MGALSLARLAHAHDLEQHGGLESSPVVREPAAEAVGSRRAA